MSIKNFVAGEVVFKEGDQGKSAYFIKKGIIRIFKKKGESTIEIDTIRAGQLLGELAFLDNQPRSASAEAIVETEIVEISQTVLEETLTKTPEWLKVLLKTITTRLRSSTNKIRELESSSSAYETDKWGNRSREFVYVSRSEFLRFCSALVFASSRYGEPETEGVRFPSGTLDRFSSQAMQLHESKVVHLIETLKAVNLLKTGPDNGPKPTLYLTDGDFLDRLMWFVNDQNILEASKQRSLSERGFLLLNLMMKHIHQSNPLPANATSKEVLSQLNMARILATDGKTICNPPLRADELQELMDQKFVSEIKIGSADSIEVVFQRERLSFEFRVFRVLNEIEKLNERKRKVK